MADRAPSLRRRILVGAIALGAVVLAVLVFGVELRDDAYVTYWVAEQLGRSGRLVNVNGARLEQSSSLALVLVLGALYALTHAPLPLLGYLVGLASLAATVVLSASLARRIRPGTEVATAVVVTLAYPLLFWATGGLETMLAAASVLWFLCSLHALTDSPRPGARAVVAYACSVALVVTVRPDTMLWSIAVALLVAGATVVRAAGGRGAPRVRGTLHQALLAVGVVVGAALALSALRLALFGALLPQPDLAKAGGLRWLGTGLAYVTGSLPWWVWLPLLALVATGAWWSWTTPSTAGLLAVAGFAVGVVGITFTRGDWMDGARLLVPYLAPGLVTAVVGAWALRAAWRRAALLVLLAVECVALVLFANGAAWLSPAYQSPYGPSAATTEADVGSPFGGSLTVLVGSTAPRLPWYDEWDFVGARDAAFLATATPVLRRLLRAPHGRVTIASTQAGLVIGSWEDQFPGRLEFVDLDDVVTDDFARCTGLRESYGGDVMTFARWVRDAGACAPPLPDLVFLLGSPSAVTGLLGRYHLVAVATVAYRQHHLFGATTELGASEFLAVRDGWPAALPGRKGPRSTRSSPTTGTRCRPGTMDVSCRRSRAR